MTLPLPDLPPAELVSMFQHSPLLIAVFDQHDLLRYANPAFREALNIAAGDFPSWQQMMRHNHAAQTGPIMDIPDIELWLSSVSSRRGKTPFRSFESDFTNGQWVWMTESLDPQGWMLCIGMDITHFRTDNRTLRVARDQALRHAHTDELTSISNRRHIMQRLAQAITETAHTTCCIALVDIDHFKAINDRFGHPIGDQILQHCARQLQNSLRRSDGVGRIGGEEFLLILPEMTHPQAISKLTTLLQQLAQTRPVIEEPDFGYTCSIGIATLQHGDSPDAAYRRADNALYQAKRSGRNQVAYQG